jgi:hypothetical protein
LAWWCVFCVVRCGFVGCFVTFPCHKMPWIAVSSICDSVKFPCQAKSQFQVRFFWIFFSGKKHFVPTRENQRWRDKEKKKWIQGLSCLLPVSDVSCCIREHALVQPLGEGSSSKCMEEFI